jgi:hypothetical protein
MAEGPKLTITSPTNARAINNQLPFFRRKKEGPFDLETEMSDPVTLNIYAGTVVGGGALLQVLATPALPDGTWSLVALGALSDGVYTAQATAPPVASVAPAPAPPQASPAVESPAPKGGPSGSGDSTSSSGGGGSLESSG